MDGNEAGGPSNQSGHALRAALNPRLSRLLGAMLVINTGSAITTVALPLLVVARFGLGVELAGTLSLRLIPMIVAGGLSAWVLSRFDARWIAATSAIATGLVTGLIPLTNELWTLNVLALASGFVSVFAGPAMMALRAGVIPTDHVVAGNALVVVAERASLVIGPAIAAAVLLTTDVETLFFVEAAATLAAAFLLVRLPKVDTRRKETGSRQAVRQWFGFLRSPRINGYVVTGLSYTVAVSAGRIVLIVLATNAFAQTEASYALLLGAMAAGAVLGGLSGSQIPPRWLGRIYVAGSFLEALLWIGVGFEPSLLVCMLLLFGCGVLESVATTAFFADVQLRLPPAQAGSFFVIFLTGVNAAAVAGTGLGAWATESGHVLTGTLIVAAFIAIPFLPYLGTYLRTPPPNTTTAAT